MIFLTMQTDVKAYSGEQDAARIKAAINNVYRHILDKIKWPQLLITCATPITLVAGTQVYGLATDFKWMRKVWIVDPTNGEPVFLTKKRGILNNVNQGTSNFYRVYVSAAGTATTRPTWSIGLESIPDAAFVSRYTYLYYQYYYQPNDMSSDLDLPHIDTGGDQVIVYGATLLLNAKQDDTQGFAMIGKMYQDGIDNMVQRAIELWGDEVIIPPGSEITEYEGKILDDYGVQKFASN